MSEQALLENQLIDKTIAQRNSILEEAKKRAQQILENAEAERVRIMDQTSKNIEGIIGSELRGVHDRIVGRAELDGRKELMDARMEVLRKVYDKAMEDLKNIASGEDASVDYQAILLKLIKESDEAMAENNYIVSANSRDIKALKKIIKEIKDEIGKDVRISETPLEIVGGVVVRNPDETKLLENTLENRLKEANDRLQSEIANTLGVI